MEEIKKTGNYYGDMGSFDGGTNTPIERKDIIVQSLWTKPLTDKTKLKFTLFIAALSLTYAHANGYKVHMHTDSKGYDLLKDFGYEKLVKTLDKIPKTVPTDLFAAGKFYAMKAEGTVGKVHTDIDVFLKKPGILDVFYRNTKADFICQQEEDMTLINHDDIIYHMHILGYPVTTRPNWNGSMNTGIIGFHDRTLATKYFNNYTEALKIYTADKFEQYKKENPKAVLTFDFILEQRTLSYMSVGKNPYVLIPTTKATYTADKLGYQHLQGETKWSATSQYKVKSLLQQKDKKLYTIVNRIAHSL